MNRHLKNMSYEDLEQVFSFDIDKDRIEELASEVSLLKIDLKIATEKAMFWQESYREILRKHLYEVNSII